MTSTSGFATRVVPRLDIKGPNLVKGIHLEGLRVIGDPGEHAIRYYEQGADELLYVDIVASLYERNNLVDVVERTASRIFVPLTVGGGVRKLEDVARLLRAGADKVAINTGALRRPKLLEEAARTFGSQCIVLSVEAKRRPTGGWEAFTDNGREATGVDVEAWLRQAVDLGVGEVLLTSVDREGTKKGFDLELLALARTLPVPVIASGGAGSIEHLVAASRLGVDALCVASMLHYRTTDVGGIKRGPRAADVEVRL